MQVAFGQFYHLTYTVLARSPREKTRSYTAQMERGEDGTITWNDAAGGPRVRLSADDIAKETARQLTGTIGGVVLVEARTFTKADQDAFMDGLEPRRFDPSELTAPR